MYSIDGLCPSGQPLGGYGFQIHLAPLFRDAVTAANLTQVEVDRVLATYGQEWLQKCGFARYFDPENCGFRERHPAIPSPETRPTYNHRELRLRGALGPHDRVVTVRLQETPDGDQQLQAALAPENSRCCFCLPTPETPETA